MTASNTQQCFRELISHRVVGVLFNTLPRNADHETTTIVLDDGTGLTISHLHGSYWRESTEEIRGAVAHQQPVAANLP